MSFFSRVLSQAIVTVKRPYFSWRMTDRVWAELNQEARQQFEKNPVQLNTLQARLVGDLRQNGIAFTSLSELFPNESEYLAKIQASVEAMREGVVQNRKKAFLYDFYGSSRVLDLSHPLTGYSFRAELLDVVNAYLKMWARHYYFYLGETLPVNPSDVPVGSQAWHRDPEDRQTCKVFLYLSDVNDVGAGPFTYLRGSQQGGPYRKHYPQKFPQGSYPPAGAVEKLADPKDILTCLGRAGTIIFADTSGLHKGGFSTTTARLMYTAGFSSFASHCPRMYAFPQDLSRVQELSLSAKYALGGK